MWVVFSGWPINANSRRVALFVLQEVTMRLVICAVSFLLLVISEGFAQRPVPQGIRQADAAEDQTQKNIPPPASAVTRVNTEKLSQEAEELARIAQTIPVDIVNLQKGVMAKGVIDKLKRIEKLSKSLRGAVSP
jgi:hypothetical protein